MISSEVQRTLVKSPPELWAELSDPAALARHLGELGEIRITKTKPERSVEWEAEAAKGRVELQPSGWGTRVTLSVTLDMPDGCGPDAGQEEDDAAVEAQASTEPEPHLEPEQAREDPVAAAELPAAEPDIETAVPEAQDQAAPEAVEPAPKLGFFARLFRRRATTAALAAATAAVSIESKPVTAAQMAGTDSLPAAEPEMASAEQEAAPSPQLAAVPTAEHEMPQGPEAEPSQPAADLAAELAAGEEAISAQTTELLTAVLDRLGSAHHRPFSRA